MPPREVAEKVQLAFKLFLNVSPTVTGWSSTSDEFSLVFDANPVAEFVELPDNCYNLGPNSVETFLLEVCLEN